MPRVWAVTVTGAVTLPMSGRRLRVYWSRPSPSGVSGFMDSILPACPAFVAEPTQSVSRSERARLNCLLRMQRPKLRNPRNRHEHTYAQTEDWVSHLGGHEGKG